MKLLSPFTLNLPRGGAAIATHHNAPAKGSSFSNLVRVAWRLADVLGFAAIPSEQPLTSDDLIAVVPGAADSSLGAGFDAVKGEVTKRLQTLPK